MTRPRWPSMEKVEEAGVGQLLDWNEKLPAPEDGTDEYDVQVRIVERLREVEPSDENADHPGWPTR